MSREIKIPINSRQELNNRLGEIIDLVERGLKGGTVLLTLGRMVRSLAQNNRMWAVLTDIAKQVEWHGMTLSKEDWKEMFSAIQGNQRVVPGLQGGFVVLGVPTRKQDKQWFSDLFELINSFGAEHNVRWSDPALKAFEHHKEAKAA